MANGNAATTAFRIDHSMLECVAHDRRRSKPKLVWSKPDEFDWNDEWQRHCDSLPLFPASLSATSLLEAA